jgi:DNA-binding Xre family transcriptional regulator
MVLARRKMKPKGLAARIGITEANLSPIKQRS